MCRLFALRANQPTRVSGSLLRAVNSLCRQSCGDAFGERHDSGWGVGYYAGGQVQRLRSALPADRDPHFRVLAESVAAPTLLAHVRKASVGAAAVRNSHPFLHGPWLFAHNGTLVGFEAVRQRVRDAIPLNLRRHIQGETDSEHAFFFLLARLEETAVLSAETVSADLVGRMLVETVRALAELCPDRGAERSAFNFVLTDGRLLLASRWGRSLSWLERHGPDPAGLDPPREAGPSYHAVVVASEPTTAEAWSELPERTVLTVGADLGHAVTPIC